MSSNKEQTQNRANTIQGETSSRWNAEARESWVSMAIAAATASIRATAPATNVTAISHESNTDTV